MPQQINLLDASLLRKRDLLGSAAGLIVLAATLGVSAVIALGLHLKSAQTLAQTALTEASLVTLQAQVASAGTLPASLQSAELARLNVVDSGQRRLRAALDAGQIGGAADYSEYLRALSRQTQGKLWLTSFSIAPDGHSFELGGRMTDPHQLPEYLRHLNAEPLFKGREFAQLSMKTVESGAATDGAQPGENTGPAYAEFALHAAMSASAPR